MRYGFRTVPGTPALQPLKLGIQMSTVPPPPPPAAPVAEAPAPTPPPPSGPPTAVEWLTTFQALEPCEAYFSGSLLDYAVGESWTVDANCNCVGIAYTANGNHGALTLRLWNLTTATLLASVNVASTVTGVSTVSFAAVPLTAGMTIVTDGYVAPGLGYYRHNVALSGLTYGVVQPHVTKLMSVYGPAGVMASTGPGGHFYGVGPITEL